MEVIQTMGSLVLSFGVFDGPNAIKCNIYIYIAYIYIYIHTMSTILLPFNVCSIAGVVSGVSGALHLSHIYWSPGHQISCQSSSSLFWVQRCLLSFVNSQSNPPFSPRVPVFAHLCSAPDHLLPRWASSQFLRPIFCIFQVPSLPQLPNSLQVSPSASFSHWLSVSNLLTT